MVAVHIKGTGTHKRPFMGEKPTGKKVSFEGLDLIRMSRGKAVEVWHFGDEMMVLQQLGVKMPGS